MTTLMNERITTGDVLELEHDGRMVSALVLLAGETALILDPCDDTTPFVVTRDELVAYRKFDAVA